jgi:hypothetical protein
MTRLGERLQKMSIELNIIERLAMTRAQTLGYFDLPEQNLAKTYSRGKWNVKKILIHLADAESVLHERIKRIIAEPRQVIWAFDQDCWCENLDYENDLLELSKSLYLANRQVIIHMAEKYYEKMGNREFVHSGTGLRTLRDEFDKVASHNQTHLKQIEDALKTTSIC